MARVGGRLVNLRWMKYADGQTDMTSPFYVYFIHFLRRNHKTYRPVNTDLILKKIQKKWKNVLTT
jgi:hypothetical protein